MAAADNRRSEIAEFKFARPALSGAIISVTYDDTTGQLSVTPGAIDYGNQYDAQEGNVFVGNNRSY